MYKIFHFFLKSSSLLLERAQGKLVRKDSRVRIERKLFFNLKNDLHPLRRNWIRELEEWRKQTREQIKRQVCPEAAPGRWTEGQTWPVKSFPSRYFLRNMERKSNKPLDHRFPIMHDSSLSCASQPNHQCIKRFPRKVTNKLLSVVHRSAYLWPHMFMEISNLLLPVQHIYEYQ